MILFFVLSLSLRSRIEFSESDVWWWCGCGPGVVLGSTGFCGMIWFVGVLMSWVHVFSVISVVLVSVVVWCWWVWGLFLFCFYSRIVVWVKLEAWGFGHAFLCCVRVVICFCRLCHCCLSFPCLPHLGERFCWFLDLGYLFWLLLFFLERGSTGRGLLSRRLVRRRWWRPRRWLGSFLSIVVFLISPLCCSPGLILWTQDRLIVVACALSWLVSAFYFWCWSWFCARFGCWSWFLVLVLVLFCVFGLWSFPCIALLLVLRCFYGACLSMLRCLLLPLDRLSLFGLPGCVSLWTGWISLDWLSLSSDWLCCFRPVALHAACFLLPFSIWLQGSWFRLVTWIGLDFATVALKGLKTFFYCSIVGVLV